jgi:O-antigen/teichoic acid export membrane protein
VSLSRNFALLALGQVASQVFAFVTTLHLARTLGAEGFGVIALATGLFGYAALLVDFGFDSLGPLEVARGGTPVPVLVRTVLGLRLLLSLIAFPLLAIFAWLSPVPRVTEIVILSYGLSLPIRALDLQWLFLGGQSMGAAAAADVAPQALQALGAFVFVTTSGHVTRMPFVFLASQLTTVAILAVLYRCGFGPIGIRLDRQLLRRLLPAALPLGGGAAVGMVLHNFDLVLVGLWLGTKAAGLYGAAYRIIWIPMMLLLAYSRALRPTLARVRGEGMAAAAVLAHSTRVIAALGVGTVAGGMLLAAPLIEWLYGPGYGEAVAPFRILLASLLLMILSRPYRVLLVAFDRGPVDFRILLGAAALDVALNLLLVPRAGLMGAAVAILTSEAALLVAAYTCSRRLLRPLPLVRYLVKPALCAAGMALVLLLLPTLAVPARMALGASVYITLLFGLRVVDAGEIRAFFAAWLPAPVPR